MFRNVLVGVDGRDGGRDAIALARRLLDQAGDLTLAYVYPGDARSWQGPRGEHETVDADRVAELLESAAKEADLSAALSWRQSSSVGRGLHELCELRAADLLVVGSSRGGLMGRVRLGDRTHAALNAAPCAIAVAPAGYGERSAAIRRIGVAYDGSPESNHALEVARTLAAGCDAYLSALEVVTLPTYALVGDAAALAESIDGLVEDAYKRIQALDGVEPHAAYGIPVEELALYSASVDLLVVGSRGYGPLGRVVHGSTSQQLARTARCPLLVLPRTVPTGESAESGRDLAGAS
jgi:nucleotide-binding universal stress UspA family protein